MCKCSGLYTSPVSCFPFYNTFKTKNYETLIVQTLVYWGGPFVYTTVHTRHTIKKCYNSYFKNCKRFKQIPNSKQMSWLPYNPLKGTVQRDFGPLVIFHHSNQWVKISSNSVSFSPRYSYFSVENTDSAKNHTARSQKKI